MTSLTEDAPDSDIEGTQKAGQADNHDSTPGTRRYRLRHTPRRIPWRDNLTAALAYCEAGFEIIPLWPASKFPALASPHPVGSSERGRCKGECGQLGHGFHDASSDAERASEIWGARPDYGIAVRPAPGMIVLDVDPRHGGRSALNRLEGAYGPLPETMTVISGRGDGGRHLWFDNVHGPVRQKLGPGLDLLAHDRSAVTMPPSLHAETLDEYYYDRRRFQRNDVIADAPQWLCDLAVRPERNGQYRRSNRLRVPPSMVRHRCRGLLRTMREAAEGERRSILFWAACRAAQDGLLDEEDRFYTALVDAASDAGLDEDEIDRTISGAILTVVGREAR